MGWGCMRVGTIIEIHGILEERNWLKPPLDTSLQSPSRGVFILTMDINVVEEY
jgi:hypothetical protein